MLSHIADTEAVEEPGDGRITACFDCFDDILSRFFCHPFQGGNVSFIEKVKIRKALDQARLHHLAHELRPEAVYVHGSLGDEVLNASLYLSGTGNVLTPGHRLALRSIHFAVTDGTSAGKGVFACTGWPLFLDDLDHFRNDVTSPLDQYRVADPDVLAVDLVLIVKGGTADSDAAYVYGSENCYRCYGARSPHGSFDILNKGCSLLCLKLSGNGPAGRAASRSQPVSQTCVVDLDDDSVDFIRESIALILPFTEIDDSFLDPFAYVHIRIDGKAPRCEGSKGVPVGWRRETLGIAQFIAKEFQWSLGGNGRIQLAQTAGGGVSGIGERRLILLQPCFIQAIEAALLDECLASNLHNRWDRHAAARGCEVRTQTKGDGSYCP